MGLDIEDSTALRNYLIRTGRLGREESVVIRNLAGGVSNRTVLIERPAPSKGSGEAWVLKQALAKLRVSVDWFCDPARIEREALGLRWLEKLAPPGTITPLVFEDPTEHLLAMRAVPKPHDNLKDVLLAGQLNPDILQQYIVQLGRLLGTIHQRACENREELSRVFTDRSYFETLRIEPYYAYTATQVPQSAEFYNRLIQQTRNRLVTLVHGDFSPKNILVRNGKLVLLDHEVCHWGEPAFDLGFVLTHLLSKAHHVTSRQADYLKATQVLFQAYLDAIDRKTLWSADAEKAAIGNTLGCLLARVSGRSPLEYLDPNERVRQRETVIHMMVHPPGSLSELCDSFVKQINAAS